MAEIEETIESLDIREAELDKVKRDEVPENKVVTYHDWCKRCELCVHYCPVKALELDEEGYPYLAYPEKCTSCGICEWQCPDFAIVVTALREGYSRKMWSKKKK